MADDTINLAQKASRALRAIEDKDHPDYGSIAAKLAWFNSYASKLTVISECALCEDWLETQIADSLDMDWQASWAAQGITRHLMNEVEDAHGTV